MTALRYVPVVRNPIDWGSPAWGGNVHVSETGSDLDAEQ